MERISNAEYTYSSFFVTEGPKNDSELIATGRFSDFLSYEIPTHCLTVKEVLESYMNNLLYLPAPPIVIPPEAYKNAEEEPNAELQTDRGSIRESGRERCFESGETSD